MVAEKVPHPVILGRYAGFFSRGVAYLLDRIIVFGVSFVIIAVIQYFLRLLGIEQWIENLNQSLALNAVIAILLSTIGINLLVSIGYNLGFWLLSGQTPGKRVMGVRVLRTDGTRLNVGNALRRQIGYWISTIFYLGFLWILLESYHRQPRSSSSSA